MTNIKVQHLHIGKQGENLACEYLVEKGYKRLHRNWRYKNHHEIDLIVTSPKDQLVGVEVRTHQTQKDYEPFESIHGQKVSRIKKALEIFADQHFEKTPTMRIDVISVIIETNKIEHFESVDLYLK